MKFFDWLFKLLKPSVINPDAKRVRVQDVMIGQVIVAEWWNMVQGGIANFVCINNDPETEKIFVQINWSTGGHSRVIFDYGGRELKNFHLLNPHLADQNGMVSSEETDIAKLQKQMNEALDKEQYEIVEMLQQKINKLLKK